MNNNFDNAMRRQVYSLPDFIETQYTIMEPRIREALSFEEIFSLQRIVLLGCGDSYAAALATKQAFEELTKIPIEVLSAIDVARFYPKKRIGDAPNCPLVITISNSGKVSRVKEAILRMNELGALTLGVTATNESPLGKSCKKTILSEIEKFESAPGVRGYVASVISLLLIAIRIGEVKGRFTMDQAKLYRNDLKNTGYKIREALEEIDEKTLSFAQSKINFTGFDFVGAGVDYAAAWYSHAKMIEAAGMYSMHINTEEWLHLNFFLKNCETTGTLCFLNSKNNSKSRMIEVLNFMKIMKRPSLLVTDLDEKEIKNKNIVIIPKTDFEINSSLISFIPGALLAGYISVITKEPFKRGFKNNWEFAKDASAIRESKIEIIY